MCPTCSTLWSRVRKTWRILTWSPAHGQRWWFTAFRLLYTVPTVIILFGWADDTVVFDGAVTDDDIQVEKEPNWNADIYIGDGKCLVIETRATVEC